GEGGRRGAVATGVESWAPAILTCGQRNVIRTSAGPSRPGEESRATRRAALDGHGYLAGAAIGRRVEHDVDAPHVVRSERALERRAEVGRLGHERAAAAERLDHQIVAGGRQRRRDRALGAEELEL